MLATEDNPIIEFDWFNEDEYHFTTYFTTDSYYLVFVEVDGAQLLLWGVFGAPDIHDIVRPIVGPWGFDS